MAFLCAWERRLEQKVSLADFSERYEYRVEAQGLRRGEGGAAGWEMCAGGESRATGPRTRRVALWPAAHGGAPVAFWSMALSRGTGSVRHRPCGAAPWRLLVAAEEFAGYNTWR
eukprot:6714989-Prymnesium_polylepis.1